MAQNPVTGAPVRLVVTDEDGTFLDLGGEDFSRYSRDGGMPGLLFWLGSLPQARIDAASHGGEPLPTAHSSKYFPDPEPTISTGVRAMSALALDLLGGK